MQKVVIRILLATLLLAGPCQAFARDLPKQDPVRQVLLDAVRDEAGVRFIVKDLFRDGDFAYLCALKTTPNGEVYRTDEAMEVYQWVFLQHKERWFFQELGGRFASSTKDVDCSTPIPDDTTSVTSDLPSSASEIGRLWVEQIEERQLHLLRYGRLEQVEEPLASALKAHRLFKDVAIEQAKNAFDKVQSDVASDQCGKDAKCRAAVKQHYANLAQMGKDPAISSLVWYNCQYGLRVFDPGVIEQCVASQMHKPYCRPGMQLIQHRPEIQHCLADIDRQCRSAFADERTRMLACSR